MQSEILVRRDSRRRCAASSALNLSITEEDAGAIPSVVGLLVVEGDDVVERIASSFSKRKSALFGVARFSLVPCSVLSVSGSLFWPLGGVSWASVNLNHT